MENSNYQLPITNDQLPSKIQNPKSLLEFRSNWAAIVSDNASFGSIATRRGYSDRS
ncbi:hypothetical protein MiSe_53060 [Microseira wollei NIES-4236]|uniref:Uncharacterized protein n=1 Tax=Microseira wollei NIES-4236 TaxID=2530354 RepID=A0AAV3XLU2_9CYAN|nr:hypothetical protein MiSe_53060 [Microseira wollei NIES-4236]